MLSSGGHNFDISTSSTHIHTVSIKSKLPCVTMWKAYAPAIMAGDDFSDQRLVAVKKPNDLSTSGKWRWQDI